MYSTFDFEDIKVTDKDGLKRFLEEFKDTDFVGELDYDEETNTLSFEGMTDSKIISYWYPGFVHMLRMIALFIEGQVIWSFENHDEGGYVTFENGKVYIHCGTMQWTTHTAAEMIGDRAEEPLVTPDWIAEQIVAREI